MATNLPNRSKQDLKPRYRLNSAYVELEQARQLVWALVFHNWNSNDKTPAPAKTPRTREYSRVKVLVGYLIYDTPPGTAREERQAGAGVYIRPEIIADSHTVEFPTFDLRGFRLPDSTDILYTPDYLSDVNRARSQCVMNMDKAELKRQGRLNTRWVVYYLRHRLRLSLIKQHNGRDTCEFACRLGTRNTDVDPRDQTQPTLSRDQEDLTPIVNVELCSDHLNWWEHDTNELQAYRFGMGANHQYHGRASNYNRS
ncbi:hypothetical protein CGCVW01_v011187 [Colletotrichum viniferum]|nr:hypothetical protein CGCVW01_v011187 [Colletotrichum viniferum]